MTTILLLVLEPGALLDVLFLENEMRILARTRAPAAMKNETPMRSLIWL
jgi:hypothetical protein